MTKKYAVLTRKIGEFKMLGKKGKSSKPLSLLDFFGGVGGIRTHGPLRIKRFRVLFVLGTFVSAVVGGGSFGNGENPCAATDFGRTDRY